MNGSLLGLIGSRLYSSSRLWSSQVSQHVIPDACLELDIECCMAESDRDQASRKRKDRQESEDIQMIPPTA